MRALWLPHRPASLLGVLLLAVAAGCPPCDSTDPADDSDAGELDAGSLPADSGEGEPDAGPGERDAGPGGDDAGAEDAGAPAAATIASFRASPAGGVPPFTVTLSWTLSESGPAEVPCELDVDDDGSFDLAFDDCRTTTSTTREVSELGRYTSTLEIEGGDRRFVSYAGCEPPVEIRSIDFNGFADQRWEDVYAPVECTDYRVVAVEPALTLTVLQSSTLRIDPGVRVELEPGLGIEILGSLEAVGTPAAPIALFGTEPSRGHWRGLLVYDPPGGVGGDVELAHVEVAHAGGEAFDEASSPAGIAIVQSRAAVSIRESLVRATAGPGLLVEGSPAALALEANTFEDNTLPARVEASYARDMDGASVHEGNDEDVVELFPTDLEPGSHEWDALDVPYRVRAGAVGDRLDVRGAWALEGGAVLELPEDLVVELDFGVAMEARGTEAAPVILRSADPRRAQWGALVLNDATHQLDHLRLLHGGSRVFGINGPNTPAATLYLVNATVFADHLRVAEGAGFGVVYANGSARLELSNATFTGNLAPAQLERSQASSFAGPGIDVSGNEDDRIHVRTGLSRSLGAGLQRWSAFQWFVYGGVSADDATGLDVEVLTGTEWRLASGATVDFAEGVGIQVLGGVLRGVGTDDASLLLRRAPESDGSWGGIVVADGSEVAFTHTDFRNGYVPSFDPEIPDALFAVGVPFGAPAADVVLGEGLSQLGAETGVLIGPNTDVVGMGCMFLGFTLLDETGSCED